MIEAVLHAAIGLAILGCYTALTLTGHDGNVLLGFLGGQGVTGAVRLATTRT